MTPDADAPEAIFRLPPCSTETPLAEPPLKILRRPRELTFMSVTVVPEWTVAEVPLRTSPEIVLDANATPAFSETST